ncbi:Gfo/Idh/MocA family oxidoreductase [Paracoccaceae bacterium]|nr:Gfo/Idh/MocA family oxidoreductase [Paracoccaceae bacterium]
MTHDLIIVGCGYVSYFYANSIVQNPKLNLIGAFDIDTDKLDLFCTQFRLQKFDNLQDVFDTPCDLILNLTSINAHHELNCRLLKADKNVFCEKPVVTNLKELDELNILLNKVSGSLFCAPTIKSARFVNTVKEIISKQTLGQLRHILLRYEAGLVHHKEPWKWKHNELVKFPACDEFKHGMVLEHAPYCLDLLHEFTENPQLLYSSKMNLIPDRTIVTSYAVDHMRESYQSKDGVLCDIEVGSNVPESRVALFTFDYGYVLIPDIRNENDPVLLSDERMSRWKRALTFRIENIFGLFCRLFNIYATNGNLKYFRKIAEDQVKRADSGKPVDFSLFLEEIVTAISANDEDYITASYERLNFIHRNLLR